MSNGQWAADRDEMRRRRQLARRADSNLSREECETGIQFFGDANRYEIITYAPTLVRKLLEHRYAKIRWVFASRVDDGGGRRVEDLDSLSALGEYDIEAVMATLPIGTLTIKGSPRKYNKISAIAHTPEEIEGVAEAFGEGDDGE